MTAAQGKALEPPAGHLVDLAYLSLSKEAGPIEEDIGSWSPADLESAEAAAREVIRSLREAGGVSFSPGESGRGVRGGLASLLGKGMLDTGEEVE
jgi:hypothetical protein